MRKYVGGRRGSCTRDEVDTGCLLPADDDVDASTNNPMTLTVTTTTTTTTTATAVFHTLGSLDEEEADSDESGYVEASPKSSMDRTELKCRKEEMEKEAHEKNNNETSGEVVKAIGTEHNNVSEKAEFIKCPISETIKKLANASLRSSKAMRVSTTSCLESLKSTVNKPEIDGESPSLMQRKRLLAQQGVTV